jgi:transcriptional regulator with XRE-family HTH domain
MNIQLGDKLKKLRRLRDITQEELSAALGVSPQSVSNWERGDCYPDTELLPKIAGYFEVSLDELFGMANLRADERVAEALKLDGDGLEISRSQDALKTSLAIWRAIAEDYPHNDLAQLRYAMRLSFFDEAGAAEQAAGLLEALLKRSTDSKIRYEAESVLSRVYSRAGETKKAYEFAFSLPKAQQGFENAFNYLVCFDPKFREVAGDEDTADTLRRNSYSLALLLLCSLRALDGTMTEPRGTDYGLPEVFKPIKEALNAIEQLAG